MGIENLNRDNENDAFYFAFRALYDERKKTRQTGPAASSKGSKGGIDMKHFIRKHHNFLMINLGCAIFSLAYILFFNDNCITPGGMAGLSIILEHLTKGPFGLLNLLVNIPGIILGLRILGLKSIALTLYAIAASSVMIDVGNSVIPTLTGNIVIASVVGGVVQGVGLGVLYNANSSIGGTSLLGMLLNLKLPSVRLGTILILMDGCVVLLSLLVFGNPGLTVVSLLAVLLTSKIIDQMINKNSKLYLALDHISLKLSPNLNMIGSSIEVSELAQAAAPAEAAE